jgi:hypothetical protein
LNSITAITSDGRTVNYYPDLDVIQIEGRSTFKTKFANSELKELFNLPPTKDVVLPFYPGRYPTGERY